MFQPFSLFIGLRYTGSKRRSQLVSFISMVSMLGLTIGVALLIVVLSVMNGFDREMRERILGLVPHITIRNYSDTIDLESIENRILQHTEVSAAAPFVQLNAMLLRGTDVEGVLIYGIDPTREQDVSIIEQYLPGNGLQLLQQAQGGLLLGGALAKKLGLDVGDAVNLMVPQESPSRSSPPRFKRLTLTAVFDTGTEIDQSIGLISLHTASTLQAQHNSSRGLRISVNNTFEAPRIAWELSQNLPFGFVTRDWTQSHGNLYSAIQLSKQLVGLMLLTIIAVAAFNVVSALVMVVTDKQGDIAILRTLGATPAKVMSIFMVQGTLVGCLGTLAGAVIGVGLSLVVTDLVAWIEQLFAVQFLQSDVYPVNYLPSDLRLVDVLQVCATALVMSFLATIYPAWRASRVQPAQALRYE